MIALLIQDCETALEEEEFVTACSTEGATLPMIYFEVRELPDEETPTPAYLNWTARRLSRSQSFCRRSNMMGRLELEDYCAV